MLKTVVWLVTSNSHLVFLEWWLWPGIRAEMDSFSSKLLLSGYFIAATETRTEGRPQTLQVALSWTLQLQRWEMSALVPPWLLYGHLFDKAWWRAVFNTDFFLSPLLCITGTIFRPLLGRQIRWPAGCQGYLHTITHHDAEQPGKVEVSSVLPVRFSGEI